LRDGVIEDGVDKDKKSLWSEPLVVLDAQANTTTDLLHRVSNARGAFTL
jgi:hypothetical protein